MTQFQLFDSIALREAIALPDGQVAPAGTPGAIVEVLRGGEAFMMELFGRWVKPDDQGNFVLADRNDPDAFVETIGVELVAPHQLKLVKSAMETVGVRTYLLSVLDDLPEDRIQEVADFAEFLRQKQVQQRVAQV